MHPRRRESRDGSFPTSCPERDPHPIRQWLDAVTGKGEAKITLADGRDLTELMEAATRSHRTGTAVELPL